MELIQTKLPFSSHPWEVARERFLDGLSESERSLFDSASLENIFYTASVSQKRYKLDSKLWSAQVTMQPLVDCISEYGTALDVYANTSSLILCPLWGSIRVVLHIAKELGKYFDRVTAMFADIGSAIPRFRVYERLFPDHAGLLVALTDSYLDIIRFCVNAKELFGKARRSSIGWSITAKVLWKSFDQQFSQDYMMQFARHLKRIEQEVDLAHMVEAKNARELEHANRALQEQSRIAAKRRQMLNILSKLDYNAQHRKLCNVRHEKTGVWLQGADAFRAWLNASETACFSLYGIAGSGKTVLAASVVEALIPALEQEGCASAYHYCDYTNPMSLSTAGILGSLMRQLLNRIEIPGDIEAKLLLIYQDCTTMPVFIDLKELFLAILAKFATVLLMIDGLDELVRADQNSFLEFIKSCMRPSKTLVKVFVTSRHGEMNIRRSLEGPRYGLLDITPANLSHDIKIVIRDELDSRIASGRLVMTNPSLKEEIACTLLSGAKDLFLWVKFQLEDICDAISDDAIRDTIQNLPKDLAETYARILQRLWSNSESNFAIANHIFRWILTARRPLRLAELREGVAIQKSDQKLNFDRIPSGDSKRLVQLCGNLVALDSTDQTVTFAHHTVQQFLLSCQPNVGYPLSVHAGAGPIHRDIGDLCLTYLFFSDFETQLVRPLMVQVEAGTNVLQTFVYDQIPFGAAVNNVIRTFHGAGRVPKAQQLKFDLSRVRSGKPLADALSEKYQLLEYILENWTHHMEWFSGSDSNWTRLYAMTFERQFVFHIRPWETDDYEESNDPSYLPYLNLYRWAIDEGSVTFLRLIERAPRGEDVSAYHIHEIVHGLNPLIRACRTGHVKVFEYLIDTLESARIHHIEQDTVDVGLWYDYLDEGRSLIVEAAAVASDEFLEIMRRRFFGRRPLPVDIREDLGRDLWDAAKVGNLHVVKNLLKIGIGANVRYSDGDGESKFAATIAAEHDHIEITKLLAGPNRLRIGLKERNDEILAECLSGAISEQHMDVVWALLFEGVEYSENSMKTSLKGHCSLTFVCQRIFQDSITYDCEALFRWLYNLEVYAAPPFPDVDPPLHTAISHQRIEMIRTLLFTPNIEIKQVSGEKENCLQTAVGADSDRIWDFLIPIVISDCMNGPEDTARFWISNRSRSGLTALEDAAIRGNLKSVNALMMLHRELQGLHDCINHSVHYSMFHAASFSRHESVMLIFDLWHDFDESIADAVREKNLEYIRSYYLAQGFDDAFKTYHRAPKHKAKEQSLESQASTYALEQILQRTHVYDADSGRDQWAHGVGGF